MLAAVVGGFNNGGDLMKDVAAGLDVPIGFNVNYLGMTYDQVSVYSDGVVSFDDDSYYGSAFQIPQPLSNDTVFGTSTVIAPFWAGVATYNGVTGHITFGTGTVDGQKAFGVEWSGVTYVNAPSTNPETNTFELLLIDRSTDNSPGDFDIEFNYNSIQWETGGSSGNANGLGGNSARVGYAGTDVTNTFHSFELGGSGTPGALVNGGANALTSGDLNSSVPGQYIFSFRAGLISSSKGSLTALSGAQINIRPDDEFNGTVATFSDSNLSDSGADFVANTKIDWGDGTTTTDITGADDVTGSSGLFEVVGHHTYSVAGFYTVAVEVMAANGEKLLITGTATVSETTVANQEYVQAVYQDVLGRAADPGGLTYWTRNLDAGVAIDSVAASIAHSDEYYANFVIRPAYANLLGRTADDAGVAYWTAQMDAGVTDQMLEADLVSSGGTSGEFYMDAGGTNTLWIDAIYKLLLGRTADTNGESYWNGQLAAGQSLNQVAQRIASSQENDTQLINNDYFHYLGRAADPGGLAYWIGQFADGKTNEDIIAGFTGSAEYYQEHTS